LGKLPQSGNNTSRYSRDLDRVPYPIGNRGRYEVLFPNRIPVEVTKPDRLEFQNGCCSINMENNMYVASSIDDLIDTRKSGISPILHINKISVA